MRMLQFQGIYSFFYQVLAVSVICSLGILLILAVSPLLNKKHTVFWRYVLWTALALRLALPFDISLSGHTISLPVLMFPRLESGLSHPEEPGKAEVQTGALAVDGTSSTQLEGIGEGSHEGGVSGEDMSRDSRLEEMEEASFGDHGLGQEGAEAPRMEGQQDKIDAPNPGEKESKSAQRQGTERTGMELSLEERVDAYLLYRAAALLWAAGAVCYLVWQVVCYWRFRRMVDGTKVFAMAEKGVPVYYAYVSSPMLVGLWKPQILLPQAAHGQDQLAFILSHELTHYKRNDLWVKLVLLAARTLHWFNPLVAYLGRQASRDMEFLCDSQVVEGFTKEEKKRYSETLLAYAACGGVPLFCTSSLSKETKTLKARLANICSSGRRKKGGAVVCVGIGLLAAVSLFVAFGQDGKDAGNTLDQKEDTVGSTPDPGQLSAGQEGTAKTEEDKAGERLLEMRSKLLGLTAEEAASAGYGVALPKLLYASEERAILSDYWGLLIYDIKNRKIMQLLDLKAAGLSHIQGDVATHIEVSEDGEQILLYNEPDSEERFVYEIENQRLSYTGLEAFSDGGYNSISTQGEVSYVKLGAGKTAYLSAVSLRTENGDDFHPQDMQGLSLIVSDCFQGDAEIYPLFQEYYEENGERAEPYLLWNDFHKVFGKERLYVDTEGWEYFVEADEAKESRLWESWDGVDALLLTRYRDGERQILEDLMYQDNWKESPVLFAEGRMIYKAAPTADIAGIKTPMLVSIAMDGGDRKVADTILYHTSDSLCEDQGWIYYSGWTNGTFPKPLCRISPDFSSGPQFVQDIPGLLCGVKDGQAYYLAAQGKDPGIWVRDLSTQEERLYDKWGVTAETLKEFSAREQEYPAGTFTEHDVSGSHLLFRYQYDGPLQSMDVAFDFPS